LNGKGLFEFPDVGNLNAAAGVSILGAVTLGWRKARRQETGRQGGAGGMPGVP
jgi:hypothetical protein